MPILCVVFRLPHHLYNAIFFYKDVYRVGVGVTFREVILVLVWENIISLGGAAASVSNTLDECPRSIK